MNGGAVALTPHQQQAEAAFAVWLGAPSQGLPFVLSGYAGTGKTFLSMRLLAAAEAAGLCWTVAAPTHKAVGVLRSHLSAADLRPTWYPATVHRLLRLKLKRQGDLERCEATAQTAAALEHLGLVLIDEASMVDSNLLEITLRCAQPYGTRLVFVGDPAQLPPVGEPRSPVFALGRRQGAELRDVVRHQGPVLQLQPLSSHDLASVMVIENQAYAFPWTSGNFRDALAAGYTALKLVDQGAMVGYCVYMRVLEEAHLLNFTIAPPRQRRGLGQAFLERLLARVADEGAASMLLEVRPSNDAGIRLYARNGFAEIGRRKGYYPAEKGSREDALLMQRALSLQAQGLREARARAIAADASQEGSFAMAQALAPDLRS